MEHDQGWSIEVINPNARRASFKSALFDFDGTISLIREGWQQVMKPYFCEVLEDTPAHEAPDALERCVHDFVDFLTGKQTIYQCIRLAEEVEKRGGMPLNPQDYKDEYHRRLMARIQHRIDALSSGSAKAVDYAVPGALDMLAALRAHDVDIYLASGTDETYVMLESALLGATPYCNGGVYGARQEYKQFSKKMIVEKILRDNNLKGDQLIGFGDGYVEIENVKEAGGFAVGVATDELSRRGVDAWKRNRLIQAGADIIIPDFSQADALLKYLYDEA